MKARQATSRRTRLAAIHACANKLGLDTADKSPDTEYRTIIRVQGGEGVTSAAALSDEGLQRVHTYLQRMQPAPPGGQRGMTQQQYIRLLWARLHKLQAIDDASPRALDAYVERVTRISTVGFLPAGQANKVIEGLKAWVARAEAKAKSPDPA